MNTKNFIVGGLVGGGVNFLAGWLFYGVLFTSQFPEGENMSMLFIFLGCMAFGFFMSYIFNKWAGISTAMTGLNAGAIIGLFAGLWSNFFMHSQALEPDYTIMLLDVGIGVISAALMGACIGFVLSKMK
jgi:UDP-N-acetylmuramyl pentapeptide phosphotransferase/UDP-N-acetylglucosamine-1-phosphate transferase